MAKGKKYTDDIKEKAFALYATNSSLSETSRQMKIPVSTLQGWINKHKDSADFIELRQKKKEEFIHNAWSVIDDALQLTSNKVKRALEKEAEIDELMDSLAGEDMDGTTKRTIYSKLASLQIQRVNELSTLIGTLYDKQALAGDESTENVNNDVNITIEVI